MMRQARTVVRSLKGQDFEGYGTIGERIISAALQATDNYQFQSQLIQRAIPSIFNMTAGLKTIISLSFVLALGFLLVILSCALFHQYLPLLVVLTFILAPLPNFLASRCSSPDDFSDSSSSGVLDLGRFATGFLCMMGVALPAVLAHSHIITVPAMVMSIIGGVLIYGTMISFGMFFQEEAEF
ncbi:putative vacuolar protein sorting 55 protein [Botrytis fragariae]|uniref:Putative vacuolar protein sorting 55 protein n=1 Tax=Botrytis fragariae TaxID=1964551 RepID=A0A8H6APQ8_9HELO|nr:putative vacuolar protein sorting 55 protein [Botrytis fragariae]KAF5871374.1 putative vacuolar protein sorting 55 protein [Botrytis fragariae]